LCRKSRSVPKKRTYGRTNTTALLPQILHGWLCPIHLLCIYTSLTCSTSVLVTCVPLHVPPAYVPGNVYDLRGTTRTVLTCLRYSYGGSVVAFRYCTHTVLVPVTCCYASSLRYPCRSYHLRTLQAKTLARSPLRRLTYRVPATRYRVLRPQDPPSVSLTYDFGHWICQIVKDS